MAGLYIMISINIMKYNMYGKKHTHKKNMHGQSIN